MKSEVVHRGKALLVRRATVADTTPVRRLINEAYKELSDRGWNYTGTYQDDAFTANQIAERRVFVLFDGDALVSTVSVHDQNEFTGRRTLYVGKFAVSTSLKKQGLGSLMMKHVEDLARSEKYEGLQLDTAKPAEHLVSWYQRLGYKIVGDIHFEGKTYDSWIFEKLLKESS